MKIRLLQPEDSQGLQLLIKNYRDSQNSRDVNLEYLQNLHLETQDIPENSLDDRADNHSFVYVAVLDQEVVGFGVLAIEDVNRHKVAEKFQEKIRAKIWGRIEHLYCYPKYQRRGVGIQIYRTIATQASDLNLEYLYAEADVTTRAFFKSRGFVIKKEWRLQSEIDIQTRDGQIQDVQIEAKQVNHNQTKDIQIKYLMEKYLGKPRQFVVAAFYHFTPLPDYQELRPKLQNLCDRYQLKGTILLAPEGINSTIAGSRQGINTLLKYLRLDSRFQGLEVKESFCEVLPFQKMLVRLKKEIVTLGVPGIDPNQEVGIYVEPQDWNQLIADPNVVVIDTRNSYEVEFGTFKGAIDPNLKSFREFPDYVAENLQPQPQQKVAMFCTGGIRCEKASAYLLSQGFTEVYHLKGGILKYLEETPPEESLWEGECFVFDDRITY